MDAVVGYSAANGTYTMPRSGRVRLDGRLVGTIVDSGRRICFTYLPEWLARPDATPISLTVPLRSEPYVSEGVHPLFENLLPESRLLDIAARKLKISKKDTFGPLQLADGAIACFIERIDRLDDATQLPLEEFCQLAELASNDKYHGSGELCVRIVRKFTSEPLVEIHKLFKLLLFRWWASNGDQHVKNLSLLPRATGSGNYLRPTI